MHNVAENSDARSAVEFAKRAATDWEDLLGSRLLGAYLIGSLAHGGFTARYSDIDVAVVLSDPLAPADIAHMQGRAAADSESHAAKLSLFWTDRGFGVGRFPPLDRIDYLSHAVTLVEREVVRPERPSLAEVRAYLRGAPFERWVERANAFSAARELRPGERKPYLRAILYPARFIYSWLLGDITSNDEAVSFLEARAGGNIDVALIRDALQCRQAGRDPDDLFAARHVLRGYVEACAGVMADAPAP
jgi:predicted nucleotidyltransferase